MNSELIKQLRDTIIDFPIDYSSSRYADGFNKAATSLSEKLAAIIDAHEASAGAASDRKSLASLMPEVLVSLRQHGYHYSLIKDIETALEDDRKRRPVHPVDMATYALAAEIVAAVSEDEKTDGCDISAGMFGPKFSALVRKIASEYLAKPSAAVAVPVGWVKPIVATKDHEAFSTGEVIDLVFHPHPWEPAEKGYRPVYFDAPAGKVQS